MSGLRTNLTYKKQPVVQTYSHPGAERVKRDEQVVDHQRQSPIVTRQSPSKSPAFIGQSLERMNK
jgi:hypothetical protein